MRRSLVWLWVGLVAWSGCREADRPAGPEFGGLVFVDSDPRGGRIFVDGEERAEVTPDTLVDVPVGMRDIGVLLDSAGVPYAFGASVQVPREGVVDVSGPLLVWCPSDGCFSELTRYHVVNSIRFAASPTGELFYLHGMGRGLFWPQATGNSYASGGGAIFAGVWSANSSRVALGAYAPRSQFSGAILDYFNGRPAPRIDDTPAGFTLEQTAWILPPGSLVLAPTVRGLAVEQVVVGRPDVDGVLLVRLTYRNITNDPVYSRVDPMPSGGVTYTDAYIGFVLDPDIGVGNGAADDDYVSYDPDLDLVFAYDGDFRETGFEGGWSGRPGLVGLRLLEPHTTRSLLTAWPITADWTAGAVNDESRGWLWLSGQHQQLGSAYPDHPDDRIGYAPTVGGDYRIAVTVGPLRLAPGESKELTVAVVIAEPQPGTFTSGQVVAPGDPLDTSRQILQVAAGLRQRAVEAEALLGAAPRR